MNNGLEVSCPVWHWPVIWSVECEASGRRVAHQIAGCASGFLCVDCWLSPLLRLSGDTGLGLSFGVGHSQEWGGQSAAL